MRSRQTVLVAVLATLFFPFAARAEPGPAEVVTAIYRRAAAGKGESGGQFLWLKSRSRQAAFTQGLAALWERADAATPAGDQSPPGFDPVTDSQDPNLKAFRVSPEEDGPDRAGVAVTLMDREGAAKPYATVRYQLLRENGRRLIDNITGASDGTPWSLRAILQNHLASYGQPERPIPPPAPRRGSGARP